MSAKIPNDESQATRRTKGRDTSRAKSRANGDRAPKRSKLKGQKLAKVPVKKPVSFRYEAIDDNGKKVTGVEKALTSGAAHLALVQRGLQPLEVTAKRSIWQFEITKKMVPRKEVMNFSRQLAVFIRAGIPIMESLEIILEETSGKLMKSVLIDMIESLRHGDTFAAAAAHHPEAFANYYVGILESAELTGSLDVVLTQLADYIDRDTKARSKVTSALVYPSVVAVMSVVTVVVLAVFVLPRFVVFFKSLNAKLPLTTRMLMSFSAFVSHWWYVIALVVVLIGAAFVAMRHSERGQLFLDGAVLRLPVVGGLVTVAILERVCRILSSLLRAGVDLPRSMTVTAESANNLVYRRALESVRDDMMEGQGLAGPIARTGLFPGAAKQMIRVGEETGTLDQQLDVAATYYSRELETRVDHATSLFEPAIIIVMGVVVGFVAVALISAMYGIYSQVKVG